MATGCSLLIRNLCFETSPDRVRQIFEKFGRVRDVYLPLDHFTKRPRGFGFVEFYEEAAAQEAMREMDRTMIDGNEVYVIIAQDRRKSPETMRRHLEQTRRGGGPERDVRRRDDFRGGRGYARGDIREVDIRYAEANGMGPAVPGIGAMATTGHDTIEVLMTVTPGHTGGAPVLDDPRFVALFLAVCDVVFSV
ncbi:CBR-RSP-4 protein, related [Neospora caninum Liverpool]|uniref:CBR-RSP-4 protein, related n=1 Tax=Neospora caninum (strain Liverpool) TaxID=572307 RepID=F0VJC1_NEOCL|nr:CBR-RSP-4 protein, related [Neospora caninum Liverpool]CBZ53832.1 CBR-RSP-4 protein, related [Neospora caninum Liverpool]|eukprot:XP_003883864.1 CBR-RSP-4 protein, related [Neospora caninum Liverpool]